VKFLAHILVWVFLAAAALSAITTYAPPVDDIDAADALTLRAAAGKVETGELDDDGRPVIAPVLDVLEDGQPRVLDEEDLAALEAAGIDRVWLREFAFARWDLSWLFGLSVVGLLASSLAVRTLSRRELSARIYATADADEAPTATLDRAITEVATVRQKVSEQPSLARQRQLIIDRLGALQGTHLQAIVDARGRLVRELGLTGYAQFMDRFAAAERQLNRAWSAAADNVLAEARLSLDRGYNELLAARERLNGR
jgi:hypothetical protein